MTSSMPPSPCRARLPLAALALATLTALPGLVLAQAAPAPAAASAPASPKPLDRAMLERRVQSIGTLIERSSAAGQIDSSGVPAARERRDNARLIHREAAEALREGDSAQAARLLDEAAREMMTGVRLAKPEQVVGEKARRDFDARLESTRALLSAQRRISVEKAAASSPSARRSAEEATRQIERGLAEAQALAARGEVEAARPLLDRAYLTARVSIEAMRRGDTLVRSLNFATPREEYDYEIDRNDTHRMLINLLLGDRKDASGAASTPLPAQMQPFVDRAAELRAQAEAQAKRGDHPAAIRTLEDATRELVRAIRAGGVYIPG